ncbi:hypothetical protein RT43_GL000577 [Enterococcus italicus DSM 15952]|nr:hypothetical protein RT43_GL000577 [Enterococcus italicus DSM 15952]
MTKVAARKKDQEIQKLAKQLLDFLVFCLELNDSVSPA